MSPEAPLGQHQRKIRFRARAVSWTLVPLVLAAIAAWFLFKFIMCMGGPAGSWTLRLCDYTSALPTLLSALVVVALVFLALALRDLARATGSDATIAGRSLLIRPAVGAGHAYRQLDADHRASVRSAAEMAVWAAAFVLATLLFYWLELSFVFALLVVGSVGTVLLRLNRGARGGPPSWRAGTDPVLPLNVFHVLEDEYVALHGALPEGYPDLKITEAQFVRSDVITRDLADAAAGRGEATPFGRHLRTLLPHDWNAARLESLDALDLAELLNGLLPRADLYDPGVVATVQLSDETREYIRLYFEVTSQGLEGEDRERFNRLLIEDAYPTAITKINEVRLAAIVAQIHATPTAALCLSGGGIRSGTFSLGVLQGLAKRGLLPDMHYLSTVSGGGYIGSWFTAWCHRHPDRMKGVLEEMKTSAAVKLEPEPAPLRQLRDYSSFTAPRPSLTSADVWSFVAIYLRNLVINWTALIPLLLAALLVPRIVTAAFYARHVASDVARKPGDWAGATPELSELFYGLLVAGFLLSVLAVLYVTINRPSRADLLSPDSWWHKQRGQAGFLRYALLPGVLAGLCLSTFWAWARAGSLPPAPEGIKPFVEVAMRYSLLSVLVVLGIAVYATAMLLGWALLRKRPTFADVTAVLFTGGGGGLLTWLLVRTAFSWPVPPPGRVLANTAWYAVLAVPAYLLVLFGAATVFVAATSKRRASTWGATWFAIEDEDREWLGRHGGWLFLTAVGWAVLSGIVVFGPLLLLMSPKILAGFGGLSGVAAALGGKSALTPATEKNTSARGRMALLLDHALTIAAALFLIVLIAALSLLTSWALAALLTTLDTAAQAAPDGTLIHYRPTSLLTEWRPPTGEPDAIGRDWIAAPAVWSPLAQRGQLAILYFSPFWLVFCLAVLGAGVGLLAGWVINLNKFSLHAAYRSRIIRAFLGASRRAGERMPNPFTGFDPQDNIQMHELRPGLLHEASFTPGGFVAFADRLKRADDRPSQELAAALSSITRGQLQRHSPGRPLSQTLKRNLLEDLNRLLDGDPGLLDRDAFKGLSISEHTRRLVDAVAGPAVGAGVPTNGGLLQKLPPHGRLNALLVVNRSVLDSVYDKELVPLEGPPPPYRLLHVVGVALNLVGGKRLAWQQRRAESCTISPLHCGSLFRGYRRSRVYGGVDGVSLGTAVTISGAAVSSNMGYHSSSAIVTFVLTLFNARLGWWLGNPGAAGGDRSYSTRFTEPPYRRSFPRMSLAPLVMEAFGLTDDTSRYVLLSDGGHFDNLGLYEMVLRRCRFIVVVDGSQDEKANFDDLGATVRKIRIDLGVEITFADGIPIYKKGSEEIKKDRGRYCAVATIRYPTTEGASKPGLLLYIKPTIIGNEPRDVLQYAAANPAFPHQPTTDQFFDEPQFESYRRLGEYAVDAICDDAPAPLSMTIEQFFDRARAHARPKESTVIAVAAAPGAAGV